MPYNAELRSLDDDDDDDHSMNGDCIASSLRCDAMLDFKDLATWSDDDNAQYILLLTSIEKVIIR